MKKLALLPTALFSYALCMGQTSFPTYHSATLNNNVHFQNQPAGFITSLPAAPPTLDGDFYIHKEFYNSEIYLMDSTKINDVNIRIDLRENLVEINHNNSIKILPISKVAAINVTKTNGEKEEFINGFVFGSKGSTYEDVLLQVLHGDETGLFCLMQPEVIQASRNPNPMLGVGEKSDRVVMKKHYLIIKDNHVIANDLKKSLFKEEILKLYGDEAEAILSKTNPKRVDDLMQLVRGLNELSKS